jgi:hypothetical protein
MKEVEKFDMKARPLKATPFMRGLMGIVSKILVPKKELTVNKHNMESIDSPAIILSNHGSVYDFPILYHATYPENSCYVAALDGFYDFSGGVMRHLGCICKRKFTNDLILIRQIKYVLETLKINAVIYPEARYSLDGTTAVLPKSLAKMVALFHAPLVVLNMKGNYLISPQWNKRHNKIPLVADLTQIVTKEETYTLSIEEIFSRIEKAFIYDDFQYQKENNIVISSKHRADHLNRILYQCPHCKKEGQMIGKGIHLTCNACGKKWEMTELGSMKAINGETEFTHIPDWFRWERENVNEEVKNNQFHFDEIVEVETLPNAKRFYAHGKGRLVLDQDGFHLDAKTYKKEVHIDFDPIEMYSCHIEYGYRWFGDALDLSTKDDSYWLYPTKRKDVITKVSFAVEAIHDEKMKQLLEKKKETSNK